MAAEPAIQNVLAYELRSAKRFRRFASLVIIGTGSANGAISKLNKVIRESVRNSDELRKLEEGLAILMPETNKQRTLIAIGRYKERYGESFDLRFGVASYPADERAPNALLTTALRRLEKAKSRDPGAVIVEG